MTRPRQSVFHCRPGRICAWCEGPIRADAHPHSVFCCHLCRQAAFRVRCRFQIEQRYAQPMRMAYLDPPFPGMAKMYKDEPSYRGEVDHAKLITNAEQKYDGFALSTSAKALVHVLPLFRREFRVCAWVKPIPVSGKTNGLHNVWEPLIVVPGRSLRPGKQDFLIAPPARGGTSKLPGRKPEMFVCWMFEAIGLLPGDTLDDVFPGSNIVTRCWREVNRASKAKGSAA